MATAALPVAIQDTIHLPAIYNNDGAYYVATWGNDANPGTTDKPWRTLSKGVSALEAGDTLYIKSGTYVQTAPLNVSASGNATAGSIIISTAPGESSLAVITGDTNGDGAADVPSKSIYDGLVELSGNFLNFQNLEVAYSKGRGISSEGSHNVISGSNVHHIWNAGIYVYGADNLIERNTVWRTADSNYCNGTAGRQCNGDWSGGIGWGDPHDAIPPGSSPRIIVRNNRVFNISGEAIVCMHTDYGLIESNVVYDNWAENIYLDQCNYTTVQKNLAYYTNDTVWWRGTDGPACGILLANEGITDSEGRTYPVAHDQKILNNILVGNGVNIFFWKGFLPGSALINSLIAHNTLVNTLGTGGIGLSIDAGPHSNTRIANNLILESSGTIAVVNQNGGLAFGFNLWSRTPPTPAASATDVIGNPLLVDPMHQYTAGSLQAEWYKLTSASPAIGAGHSLPEIPIDYWNTPRNSKSDIGFHQYVP